MRAGEASQRAKGNFQLFVRTIGVSPASPPTDAAFLVAKSRVLGHDFSSERSLNSGCEVRNSNKNEATFE